MSRRYLLEQIDEAAVVQLYADGFDDLPPDRKLLIWHLYLAALAGRDIFYDQRYRHALEMREVIEEILVHGSAVPPAVVAEIRRYTKLFWINSGPHNNLTARKFVLTCSREAFRQAAHAAEASGARFPCRVGETLDALLARLDGAFFDPAVDASVTNKAPGEGGDILAASANNLYDHVTMADLDGFDERFGPNSRLVKASGGLREEVYRTGGRYGDAIARIIGHLGDALPYAPPPMRRALDALIRFYDTGADADRLAYDVAWVEDRDSPVDTINGFIESYMDARGVKGAWEALVFVVNREKTDSLRRLAEAAPWFEERMPWDPQWRRQDVRGVTARAVDVVIETGESGPVTPIGINLPNDQRVREEHGSKSVSLANVSEAYEKSEKPEFRREFCWDADELARAERWGSLAQDVSTAIHEVLGHGSGRIAERLQGQPQLALKEQYAALEEARADLVALYFLPDPKIADLGFFAASDQPAIVRADYEAYARNALVQLRRVREGTSLEEDHMRNRQLIVGWLQAETSAIDVRVRDGKTYYVLADVAAFHEGVGRLLAQVQRIKAEGDYESAKALFETYGVHFDPSLRDEIVARVDRLNLPSYTGFVQPRLEPVLDASGRPIDVRISYPMDLEQQMLEYSGKRPGVPESVPMRRQCFLGAAVLLLSLAMRVGAAPQTPAWLGRPTHIAAGVDYFTSTDASLVDHAGPIAVFALRLDRARVRLSSVHANDEIVGLEAVQSLAARHHAVAAINGGFFNGRNGDPLSVLKEAGALVSDASAVRGAVVIRSPPHGSTELAFDQLSARVSVTFSSRGRSWTVPVAGVNTTRARGKLMLFTARYHADTDTAPHGTEWVVRGDPPAVTAIRSDAGRTPIPSDGSVLSFGGVGPALPPALAALTPGVRVAFQTTWTALDGSSASTLDAADEIVTGAGLLRVDGRTPSNWRDAEGLSQTAFIDQRHPRTVIGLDAAGFVWLVAIDGRQPDRSIGMTFADLERLCDRLHLSGALNLDGGGSTTMVVRGKVVNHPSDGFARPVSDAILVSVR